MRSRRILIAPFLVIALILAFTPQPVSADITGNHYFFAATWYDVKYTVDNELVVQHSDSGTCEITIHNLTSRDEYEYNYNGFNYYSYGSPYDVDINDSVDFLENRVHFQLMLYDFDEDSITDFVTIDVYPGFHHYSPGYMFFVNPTWETHNVDWNNAVENATGYSSVSSITDSAANGAFSFNIVVDVETSYFFHGNMTGTTTLDYDASYDDDGVLSTWELTRTTAVQNENHTINSVNLEKYTRVSARGDEVAFDSNLTTQLLIVGGVGIGCLVLGIIIGKKY